MDSSNLIIYVTSFGTIIALGTLIAIIIIEILRDKKNKKALLNALFDELKHNINLSFRFVAKPTDDFIKEMCYKLEEIYKKEPPKFFKLFIKKITSGYKNFLNKKSLPSICSIFNEIDKLINYKLYKTEKIYPYPSDEILLSSPENIEGRLFLNNFVPNLWNTDKRGTIYVNYQTSAIEKALASGVTWNLIGKRPAMNLGHLYYSLKKLDLQKKIFGEGKLLKNWKDEWCKELGLKKTIHIHQLIFEYWRWVHFRLWFLYLDIAITSSKGHIYHNDIYNIKNKFNYREWKRIRKNLTKS